MTSLEYRDCDEAALVLTAKNIDSRIEHVADGWQLVVARRQSVAASRELAEYAREPKRTFFPPRPVVSVSAGWRGVGAYIATLLIVSILLHQDAFGFDWLGAGELDVARVRSGELWRCVTALTIHLEPDHLLGNVLFGAFFGHFLARFLGDGIAWAAIVASGAIGNLLNAAVQPEAHRSIGASTAVFAALGILSALSWRRGVFRGATLRMRLAPVAAGVALLAFTGTGGENTDVFAHLAGFITGFATGFALAYLGRALGPRAQAGAGLLTFVAVVASWALALGA